MWSSIANAINGGIGVTAGIVNSIVGGIQTKKARDIDNQNLQLQKDAFGWQKEQHQIMMDREDNAVQRRVADLESAGLHPGLAAGSPAASHQAPAPATPQRANRELEVAAMVQGIMQQQAQVGRTYAEMSLINAQKRRLESQTAMDEARDENVRRNTARLNEYIKTMQHNLAIAKDRGFMTTESSEMIRRYEYIINLLQNALNSNFLQNLPSFELPAPSLPNFQESFRSIFGQDTRPQIRYNPNYDRNRVQDRQGSSRSKF